MSRSPNSEQLLAIEHDGGVLLRAGAGSGKTFVLVEHIVYLTKKWMTEFKTGNFEEFIRGKFSQVVMMTFTKKAAGEMSIRLAEKFEEIAHNTESNKEYWKIANEALPLLMVTTIDGFCKKLISNGYFPHLSTEAKVIFSPERTDQVKKLVEKWLENRSQTISQDILDIILREKRDLLSSFCNVFSDPGLRLAWRKFSIQIVSPDKLDHLLGLSFELNCLASSLQKIHALDLPHEKERSAFEKYVGEFQATGLPEVRNVDNLKNYFMLFDGKTLRGESGKKKTLSHEFAKDGLSELRDWVKKWYEVTLSYQENFEAKIRPWIDLCLELYHWIEDRLDPNQGMTFGDIEYLVALGLENKENRERIHKQYSYFIVDEFQDTSDLQFRIIQSLIGSDYNKLFCVGDAKQAIYGFRGGELSVFQDCADLVPKVLSLSNNYRSLPGIIDFNNSLFRTILPLGQEFKGTDAFTVKPEDQMVPSEILAPEKGAVEIFSLALDKNLEEEGKFSNDDINRIEAEIISTSILNERRTYPQNVCTVLYSKLKPSAELIRYLMEKNIGFTAQFKIDLLDDPISGIFVSLLRRRFDTNSATKDSYPLFMVKSYLSVLNVHIEITQDHLKAFDQEVQYWGLVEGFKKFLHRLGITNENSDINLDVVETMSELFHHDQESIMLQFTQGDNQRVSLDLRWGESSHMVQIMTAHASKGLEFETVYLGGIYTNGKEQTDGPLFGDKPGSFKWYMDLGKRDKQKSPFYLYEDEITKYKSFSESKRLFYVACTRAKKKLVWVDLHLPEKSFSIPKNSWIDGLRVWQNTEMAKFPSDVLRIIHVESKAQNSKEVTPPRLPLFFHDPVGIHSKGEGSVELAITAELSVTRLNSLLDCPRKFYLENVLKITPHEEIEFTYLPDESEEEVAAVISSAERGTSIHATISEGLSRNFIVPRKIFGSPEAEPVQWALDELKRYAEKYELISEKQIKFRFFNFMISGIPDLVLNPKEANLAPQVWDFKTGRITQDNLAHYWLQLAIYAYALFELGTVPKSEKVELVLCFVDQKKTYNQSISWEECRSKLYPIWHSQNEPWKINVDHCGQCSYGSICPR